MSEFKVGDVVECIKDADMQVYDGVKGKTYEVLDVSGRGSIQVCFNGLFNSKERFKLVSSKKKPSKTSVSITRVGDISKVELVGEFTEKQINAIMGITYGWSK